MSEWQPIETAPKDGRLVRLRNAEYYRPDLLWEWRKGRRQWETVHFTPMRKVRAKWNDAHGGPTEWMPLPPPPSL
jgi:hypothetical protein